MDTWKDMRLFISLLVIGVFLVSLITPAMAFPVAGDTRPIEGAGCMAARSDMILDSSSSSFVGISVPAGVPGSDTGILPESYLNKDAAGYNSLISAGFSDKGALIDRLSGRNSTPRDPAGGASLLVSGEGTVRFIEHEGSFFWIITTPGEDYLPDNLPAAMKVDGTRVRFEGVVRAHASNEGWVTPLSLITVSLPAEGFSSTGTVRFIELEGGFYGIITPAGDNYLPLNLPEEFQVNGLQVTFTAHEAQDSATTTLWGTPVRIDSIARFGQQAGGFEGSWSLVALNGGPRITGTAISASFNNGRVSGNTGCNQYFASYTVAGSSVTIGGIGSTKMYCSFPEGVMEQEALFFRLLSQVATWSLDDGKLVLRDESGREILVFASALAYEPSEIIEYSRMGGYAGFDDHLVLSSDGSGTVTRKETVRSVQVPELVMRNLNTHIVAADFPSLNDRYPAPQEGADYFTYSLTCGGKTVVTEDTGVPAVLVPIINILNEIVESSAPDDVIPPLSRPDFF
jgi:heat shock protein HslJ